MTEPSIWPAVGCAFSPCFSSDGQTIFHLRGAGLPQLWAMDRDGRYAQQVVQQDEIIAKLRRAPGDDRLFWTIDAGGDERQQIWVLKPEGTSRALTTDPAVSHELGALSPDGTRLAYAANDRDIACFDVVVLDIETGQRTRVQEGEGARTVSNWTGHQIVVIADRSSSEQSLWVIDAETYAAHEVPRPGMARYSAARFSKDGAAILVLTDQGGAEFMRLCRISAESGAVEILHAPEGRDVEAWSLSPDGTTLATIENDRGYSALRIGPIDGARPIVSDLPTGVVNDLAWSPDSQTLAFQTEGPTAPPALLVWEGGAVRLLYQTPCEVALAGFDLVSWPGLDGKPIPGWYAVPRGAAPAGGWPAVLWIHGGPASQTRAKFRPDMQMLLAQGYAVLMPNVRGSTGYGRAWMESDDFEHRQVAIDDVVAARHWLATQPGVDPGRIGIMGQSYGGWMVLAAITRHPALWAAAVDYYGIGDWTTLLRDTGPWRRDHRAREYGIPGQHDAALRGYSPIHRVGDVTAPLLILHGNKDPRVPMNESDQFAAAMALHHKKFRYERFDYAGHGFVRPYHQLRVYAAVAAHFREFL